jgi:integration host factor subunit beta
MTESTTKVTRDELVQAFLLKNPEMTATDLRELLHCLLELMEDSLAGGRTIEIRGFGTFEVRKRKGRKNARNPKTGEAVTVDDHGLVFFKPGRELKAGTRPLRS